MQEVRQLKGVLRVRADARRRRAHDHDGPVHSMQDQMVLQWLTSMLHSILHSFLHSLRIIISYRDRTVSSAGQSRLLLSGLGRSNEGPLSSPYVFLGGR